MSLKVIKGKFSRIHYWADLAEVEPAAQEQLQRMAALPWVRQISVMPDVHLGKGATVGSVIAMKDAVAPSAVGVDIGCGMGAIQTNLTANDLPESLSTLRSEIEAAIPVGNKGHAKPVDLETMIAGPAIRASMVFDEARWLYAKIDLQKARSQCGTLGGGNHFIELCLDEEQRVWMVLHSGSRNAGKTIAEQHIAVAKTLDHNKLIEDPDLSVFLASTDEFKNYKDDLMWAQTYAFVNREIMFELYKKVMRQRFPHVRFERPILCHHNYVSFERHEKLDRDTDMIVTRKGAISAKPGELGIIPGSMGTRSYIVEGLGNAESLTSASHGAGRRLSRTKAKQQFTLDDLAAQTAGIECRKDDGVLDEIPGAYKDIDKVMAQQKDLVKVKAVLKQVLCVKG